MSPPLSSLLQQAIVTQSIHEKKKFDSKARYLQASLIGPIRKEVEKAREMTNVGDKIKLAMQYKEQVGTLSSR